MNGIFLERMQRGDTERGKRALEEALAAARLAGIEPVVTLENLSVLELHEGRPDLAEPRAREILAIRVRTGDAIGEGEILKTLALILRDLGRSAEAAPLLERSLTILRAGKNGNVLADALSVAAMARFEDGRLDGVDALVLELEELSSRRLTPLALGYSRAMRGRMSALRGEMTSARDDFAEARRMLLADGDPDLAAISDLAWAWAEARAGDAAAAERVLDEALAPLDRSANLLPGFFAGTIRARAAASGGRFDEARRHLDALAGSGGAAESSPSLSRRIALLAARGVVAGEEGRVEGAADLDRAIALARAHGRRVDELEARTDRERLFPSADSRAALERIAREASALGLTAIAGRAARASRLVDPRLDPARN
jgi:tetratricopeptide (TPR) repeat protein